MPKKFAILLSGCGHLDGAEVSESVFSMLAIDKAGMTFDAFGLNKLQSDVVDHRNQKLTKGAERNMLSEACRITRKIRDASELKASDYDALILPGGFGVAKNFSNLATAAEKFSVIDEVSKIILDFFSSKKPIGAICIAPAIVAKVLKSNGCEPIITLGQENELLEKLEIKQIKCDADEITIDAQNKLVTTPAFMLEARLSRIAEGIEKLINAVKEIS